LDIVLYFFFFFFLHLALLAGEDSLLWLQTQRSHM
jgi:hypothetical protein